MLRLRPWHRWLSSVAGIGLCLSGSAAASEWYSLRCAGVQYQVRFESSTDRVVVRGSGLEVVLARLTTGSGSRHGDSTGSYELHTKGRDALLTLDGKLRRCRFVGR